MQYERNLNLKCMQEVPAEHGMGVFLNLLSVCSSAYVDYAGLLPDL